MKNNSLHKLRITQILFFLSLILSICNFFVTKNKGPELYPFFHWKLYTQPLGNLPIYNDYRIYGVTSKKDTVRIPNVGYRLFSQDDYYYFLSNEASKVKSKQNSLAYYKNRIAVFGKTIAPNFKYYLLVEESFNPEEIVINPLLYKKSILLSTK